MRRIPIINSGVYLSQWLAMHPARDEPDAMVFCSLFLSKRTLRPMSYQKIVMRIKEIAARAGIKKAVNPHAFRHAQATLMASKLKEPQMRMYFGWSGSSRMTETYVHLSSEQLTDAVLLASGRTTAREIKESLLLPVACPRCNEINGADGKLCAKCGMPLDKATALEIVRGERNLRAELDELKAALAGAKLYPADIEARMEAKLQEMLKAKGETLKK
jgi:hypothetical protein